MLRLQLVLGARYFFEFFRVLLMTSPVIPLMGAESDLSLPLVLDSRLELILIAREPDIVTPIGIAVDAEHRLFVVESHTHMPPQNYRGPDTDRVRVFQDTTGDGKPDRIWTYAEGIRDAMNLAFSPEGNLYVVTAREVIDLGNPRDHHLAPPPRRVLELVTQERYAHNSLLGIRFSKDGWMQISRGNTGGHPYELRGTDGSSVQGYGDGGSLVQCRPDGSAVHELATGFWNAFDLAWDSKGRLFAIDNDPDSRGPNRLLHIVPQGNYGFQSRYGGSGLHPFQAWEGELPGTLPMVAAVGEAPSGILDTTLLAWPSDLANNSLLVTVWGEHSLVLYTTTPNGASLSAIPRVLIQGQQDFRPVALAASPDGILYFTDWVLRDYPNHGQGRIWKLRARPGVPVQRPRGLYETESPQQTTTFHRDNTDRTTVDSARLPDIPTILEGLQSTDAFVRHAAVIALNDPTHRNSLDNLLDHKDPRVRVGALLAWSRTQPRDPVPVLRRSLDDPHPELRRLALIEIAQRSLVDLRSSLQQAITPTNTPPWLFQTYLAALQDLDPTTLDAYRERKRGFQINRDIRAEWVRSIIEDSTISDEIRALALTQFSHAAHESDPRWLYALAEQTAQPKVQFEAIRTLAFTGNPTTPALLSGIVNNASIDPETRAEAVQSFAMVHSRQADEAPEDSLLLSAAKEPLLAWLRDSDSAVQLEAARGLRLLNMNPTDANKAQFPGINFEDWPESAALAELVPWAFNPKYPSQPPRPQDHASWERLLQARRDQGKVGAGRRVFFSPTTGCSDCHRIDGRGGRIGPDLSTIGNASSREHLIRSILSPSDEVAPQFQGWFVETQDEIHTGLQLHHKAGGAIDLILLDGETVRFPGSQVVGYGALSRSLMPDGLEESLTVHEFLDLLAFLESRTGP